tara:strand:+ start:50144 stop:50341 length:198 start_codon:yes stop_codon:yes gene_type:complete
MSLVFGVLGVAFWKKRQGNTGFYLKQKGPPNTELEQEKNSKQRTEIFRINSKLHQQIKQLQATNK